MTLSLFMALSIFATPPVFAASENFFEVPGDHHRVSANASDTEPMHMLAVFVVDTNEENLTTLDDE
jgi:hypothetical protein